MTHLVERILKRLGWISQFSDDDVINAEIEDKVRERDTVLTKLDQAFAKRSQTNAHLMESLRIAKHRSNSFEQFEHFVRRKD